jgi:hypothetical protein
MKYITLNQIYLNDMIITDPEQRLIPKMDDNGNINGAVLLISHM